MRRILVFAYGLIAYALFFGTFCYAIGFVTGLVVPKSVDSGAAGSASTALMIDLALLTLFAVQHSGMARPGFKRWWAHILPKAIERNTYVVLASSTLILLFAFWRPLPGVVWQLAGTPAAVVWALAALGWTTVLLSTFMIGHFELFGLRQVWLELRGRVQPADGFRTPLLYRFVRHPIMLGFLIAFWSAPTMTVGRLLFALVTTGYILVAVQLEERDLIAAHGESYRRYKREVPAFLPLPGKQSGGMPAATRSPSQAAR